MRHAATQRASQLGAWGLLLLALMAVPQARADALRTLLGSLAGGEELVLNDTARTRTAAPAAAAAAQPARSQVVVRAGESLDVVIRRNLKDSPFKDALLRRAFIELNPEAFVNANANRLRAGAVLMVPGPEDVLAVMDERSLLGMGLPSEASQTLGTGARPGSSSVEERRKWVRFP